MLLRGILAVSAVAVASFSFSAFRRLQRADMKWDRLEPQEKRLALYSEQALYYSFYEDLANATRTPSFAAGVHRLLRLDGLEHPVSVNALERFNIYPEVALAAAWRGIGHLTQFDDPVDFMISAVISLAALQWASVYTCASILGGSPAAGALAILLSGAVAGQATRVTHAPVLRENFGTPWLWVQVCALTLWLQQAERGGKAPPGSRLLEVVFCAATWLFLLSWQFAPFVLLLQAVALQAM